MHWKLHRFLIACYSFEYFSTEKMLLKCFLVHEWNVSSSWFRQSLFFPLSEIIAYICIAVFCVCSNTVQKTLLKLSKSMVFTAIYCDMSVVGIETSKYHRIYSISWWSPRIFRLFSLHFFSFTAHYDSSILWAF